MKLSRLTQLNFDNDFYLARYPDVARAYQGRSDAGWMHWQAHGKTEGRVARGRDWPEGVTSATRKTLRQRCGELSNRMVNRFPGPARLAAWAWHRVRLGASRRRITKLLADGGGISLELGGGDKRGRDGWLSMDRTKQCDLYWDLTGELPFPDASVARIYSSHFLEHLSYREGQRLLGECLRILVPGGLFSICVPNARLYIEAYLQDRPLNPQTFFIHRPAYHQTTRIDYVNYIAYMDGHHKYMFDEENLLWILRRKGFREVQLRSFDPTLDLEWRDYESIYAEARR